MRISLILLIINLILALSIFYLNRQDSQLNDRLQNSLGLLSEDALQLDHIEISSPQWAAPRILERRGQQWMIVAPIHWPANFFAVQHMLSELQFLEGSMRFSIDDIKKSGQTLADYGLEKPALTLELRSQGKSHIFKIGSPSSLGNRSYLLTPEATHVWIINNSILENLSQDIALLRSETVFSIPQFEINELDVVLSQPTFLKARITKTDQEWQFEAPMRAPASTLRVQRTLSTLEALSVCRFIAEEQNDPALTGLESPSMRISIEGRQKRQTLLIGHRLVETGMPAEYFAKLEDNPTVFTVPAASLDTLRDITQSLRDPYVFSAFAWDQLCGISIVHANQGLSLSKLENASWVVRPDSAAAKESSFSADDAVTKALIDRLKNLSVIRFVSDAPSEQDLSKYGLNTPGHTVRIDDGENTTALQIGGLAADGKGYFAKTSQSASIYLIDADFIEHIPVRPLFYKTRILEIIPVEYNFTTIELTDLQTGQPIIKGNATSLLSDKNLSPEKRNDLVKIMENIRTLRVRDYLESSFSLQPIGATQWRYLLEVGVQHTDTATTEKFQLYLTERLDGSLQIGGSPKFDISFTLMQSFVDALFGLTTATPQPPSNPMQPS